MAADSEFAQVVAGSLLRNACTPAEADDFGFRGLRLAAPAKVELVPGARDPLFGAFARLMACGCYCFDSNYLGLREQFLEHIVLVAVDLRQHRAYAGRMQAVPNAIPMPSPFDAELYSDADWAGRSVTGYFNPNLAELMALPAEETDWVVYAALGSHLSNAVRIAVRRA